MKPILLTAIAIATIAVPITAHADHRYSACSTRGYYSRPYSYSYSSSYCRPTFYGSIGASWYRTTPSIRFGISAPLAVRSVGYSRSYYPTQRYVSTGRVYRGSVASDDSLAISVQRALSRRGYYDGEVDGDIGPASRAAIAEYQADRGMSATGRIDAQLLRSLGID